ncbi:DUF732 domain-containing protein [Rhodococcus hoagii]|nr:DUF732 domain-containing protein [Prescottella equi]
MTSSQREQAFLQTLDSYKIDYGNDADAAVGMAQSICSGLGRGLSQTTSYPPSWRRVRATRALRRPTSSTPASSRTARTSVSAPPLPADRRARAHQPYEAARWPLACRLPLPRRRRRDAAGGPLHAAHGRPGQDWGGRGARSRGRTEGAVDDGRPRADSRVSGSGWRTGRNSRRRTDPSRRCRTTTGWPRRSSTGSGTYASAKRPRSVSTRSCGRSRRGRVPARQEGEDDPVGMFRIAVRYGAVRANPVREVTDLGAGRKKRAKSMDRELLVQLLADSAVRRRRAQWCCRRRRSSAG